MSTPQIFPPPPMRDANEFRLRLAGLTDPDYSGDDNPSGQAHKKLMIDLCLCLCDAFGESLDRVTLWPRIGTALKTSAAKCDGGDVDLFISLCLEHVKAEVLSTAKNIALMGILHAANSESLSWRQAFIRYASSHCFAIIAHSQIAWGKVKDQRRDDRALDRGGLLSTGEIVVNGGEQ